MDIHLTGFRSNQKRLNDLGVRSCIGINLIFSGVVRVCKLAAAGTHGTFNSGRACNF